MYAQLLGLLLFTCQIILNESSVVIHRNANAGKREAELVVRGGIATVGETNSDCVPVRSETPSATQPSTLPEGYVRFPAVHAAYKVHEEAGKTWFEARDLCVAEGARLAITDSVEKVKHINSLKTSFDKWLHVGIYHNNDTDQWVGITDGLPVSTVPWIKDNPDGTGECAGISISEDGLVDYQCDWSGENYVCEISI